MLAWENLSNEVEGCARRKKTSMKVCGFLLEEVFCRYKCIGQVEADREELDSEEAREFFARHGVRLTFTITYNPKANGKIEHGYSPIVKELVKACNGEVKIWLQMLLYADRTMQSFVAEYMLAELMSGQALVIPTENTVTTWGTLP